MTDEKSIAKTITIDNKVYSMDSLSETAKQQLTNLHVVDKEISRLQTQLAIAQTARTVFASGVKSNLPDSEQQTVVPS
jgi:hypothetical protein